MLGMTSRNVLVSGNALMGDDQCSPMAEKIRALAMEAAWSLGVPAGQVASIATPTVCGLSGESGAARGISSTASSEIRGRILHSACSPPEPPAADPTGGRTPP